MSEDKVVNVSKLLDYLLLDISQQETVNKLNSFIKKLDLKIYYENREFYESKFLPSMDYSETAYVNHRKPYVIKFFSENRQVQQVNNDGSLYKEWVLLFNKIEYKGNFFYTALKSNLREGVDSNLPEGVERVCVDRIAFLDFYVPYPQESSLNSLYLMHDDYLKFCRDYKQSKLSSVPERRKALLKDLLIQKGLKPSNKLSRSEHGYPSRIDLWNELSLIDSKLFPPRASQEEPLVKKFFNANGFVSFKY